MNNVCLHLYVSGRLYSCCCSDWSVSHSVVSCESPSPGVPRERTILRQIASHQLIRTVYRAWVRTARGFSTVYPREVTDSTWYYYVGFSTVVSEQVKELARQLIELQST